MLKLNFNYDFPGKDFLRTLIFKKYVKLDSENLVLEVLWNDFFSENINKISEKNQDLEKSKLKRNDHILNFDKRINEIIRFSSGKPSDIGLFYSLLSCYLYSVSVNYEQLTVFKIIINDSQDDKYTTLWNEIIYRIFAYQLLPFAYPKSYSGKYLYNPFYKIPNHRTVMNWFKKSLGKPISDYDFDKKFRNNCINPYCTKIVDSQIKVSFFMKNPKEAEKIIINKIHPKIFEFLDPRYCCIAGGLPMMALLNCKSTEFDFQENLKKTDVDIFIYGKNTNKKIEYVHNLIKICEEISIDHSIKNCVLTFRFKDYINIQIILTENINPNDCIMSFDFSCVKAMYLPQGKSKWSYPHSTSGETLGTFICASSWYYTIITSHCSTFLDGIKIDRLYKYTKRGFTIVDFKSPMNNIDERLENEDDFLIKNNKDGLIQTKGSHLETDFIKILQSRVPLECLGISFNCKYSDVIEGIYPIDGISYMKDSKGNIVYIYIKADTPAFTVSYISRIAFKEKIDEKFNNYIPMIENILENIFPKDPEEVHKLNSFFELLENSRYKIEIQDLIEKIPLEEDFSSKEIKIERIKKFFKIVKCMIDNKNTKFTKIYKGSFGTEIGENFNISELFLKTYVKDSQWVLPLYREYTCKSYIRFPIEKRTAVWTYTSEPIDLSKLKCCVINSITFIEIYHYTKENNIRFLNRNFIQKNFTDSNVIINTNPPSKSNLTVFYIKFEEGKFQLYNIKGKLKNNVNYESLTEIVHLCIKHDVLGSLFNLEDIIDNKIKIDYMFFSGCLTKQNSIIYPGTHIFPFVKFKSSY